MSKTNNHIRLIAFYLPQFHPIPENDEWWGKGFTEWTNVSRGRPLFRGHYQPHIPADLGFYDLRLPEAREAQAELARKYGIYGFCYYHYWFKGRRILQRPFDEVLRSGRPEFPFCLFWANETWEGRWHGVTKQNEILIKQEYSDEDDLDHIRWLAEAMADRRYIRVDERPIFIVYRPLDLPNPEKTLDVWRNELVRLGLPNPYLIGSDSHAPGKPLCLLGFDALLQFLPQLSVLDCFRQANWKHRARRLALNLRQGFVSATLHVYDYQHAVRKMLRTVEWPTHRSIMPSWDNSPRSGKLGVILKNSTPEVFCRLLKELIRQTQHDCPQDRQLLFLNAWNEWAEGNHLEPDLKHGLGYLDAVKSALDTNHV